jgi:cellulose synthase/poly-beta-1,6-N-acetylglucosamine synthase-like glycosyltransferase
MSFAATLLSLAVALVGALVLYGLAYVALAAGVLLLVRVRREQPRGDRRDHGAVTVLVPAHHEGQAVVDLARSLLHQEYAGDVSIWALVADEHDDSVAALDRAFRKEARTAARDAPGRVLVARERRTLVVAATGRTAKRDKLNWALERATTPLVAFLDADHRASPDWLASACSVLAHERVRVVQSRRRPLAYPRLPQLWDTAENHVGNEVVNAVCARLGRTVFFTGTSAVFRREALEGLSFADSITEDTHLSLDLVARGERIAWDPVGSTYEEVAPGLGAYIARRRRWAAGHMRTYLAHLAALRRGPWRQNLQLMLHGSVYLSAPLVLAFLLAQGAFLFVQYPGNVQLVALAASALAASALAQIGRPPGRPFAVDLAVAFLWVLPQITTALVVPYGLLGFENYYALLAFPFASRLLGIGVVALLAPLAVILAGRARLGGLGRAATVALILTYPVQLFFGIYAALLGTADLVLGRLHWTPTARDNAVSPEAVPAQVRRHLTEARVVRPRRARWLFVPASALLILLSNDLLAVNDCGEWRRVLWDPLLFAWSSPVRLDAALARAPGEGGTLAVSIDTTLGAPRTTQLTLEYALDGAPLAERALEVRGNASDHLSITLPLGLERHVLDVRVRGDGFACRRTLPFATSLVETRGGQLFLNGEPFLVKGIIPAFSSRPLLLSLDEGYRQLKEVGANAIRVYHAASPAIRDAAAAHGLMIVDQPDRSTWEDLNVTAEWDRRRYLARYRALVEDTAGYPYLLLDNLGNELELAHARDQGIAGVTSMAREVAAARPRRSPVGYSTYFTFVDYPVDVLGVNMLDTGEMYWSRAIGLVKSRGRPFYASEFGGFVAFSERVPPELRVARLRRYWSTLLDAGAIGAFVFESHDNWSQPVPPGFYNDPLSADQPDDERGLWDHRNRPKLELRFVAELFSDVTVRAADLAVDSDGTFRIAIRNRRPYRLRGVTLRDPASTPGDVPVGDLAPGAATIVRMRLPADGRARGELSLVFDYTTHAGLPGVSRARLVLPIEAERPTFASPDFVVDEDTPDRVRGRLLDSSVLEAFVPVGWTILVDGVAVPATGHIRLPVRATMRTIEDVEVTRDGRTWAPLGRGITDGGSSALRFRLPCALGRQRILVLEGLGAGGAELWLGDARRIVLRTHNYRENLVDLAQFDDAALRAPLTVRVDRDQVLYVHGQFTPDHRDLLIPLEPPRVYSPVDVEVRGPRRSVARPAAATVAAGHLKATLLAP